MTHKVKPPFQLASFAALLALLALAPRPAQADFFDDARRTVQTDIPHFFTTNVPHFFQDDIPCAFGGQPTSGAKKSCTSEPEHGKSTAPNEPPPVTTEPVTPPPADGGSN